MSNLMTPEQLALRDQLIALRASYPDPTNIFPIARPGESRELELLNTLYAIHSRQVDQDKKYDELMQIGKGAAAALCEMVAALQVDYDRLEELRDERNDYQERDRTEPLTQSWAVAFEAEAIQLDELEKAASECISRDDAEQRIQEDALEVTMRDGWYPAGDHPSSAEEFCILLTTGGPAVRIMGELQDGEPHRAWLEVQDWGQPWTEYREEGLSSALLAYAQCFYFGE